MRILRVAQTLYPDVTGGGAYHVHAMSRDQAAMGHDVTVLTTRDDPDRPRLESRAGYSIVRFDRTAAPLGNELSIGLARYLWDAVRSGDESSGRFDVVHAHSHLYASTNLAAALRRLGSIPLAITNHGLYSQAVPERLFEGYLRTLGRWTFEQADLAFCYTEADAQRLADLGVTTDVAVVPNGVDTERFHPSGPESDLLDGEGTAVLFVGRLVDGKRPQDAVAAMDRVREAIPDATLYCCGEGPLREALEADAANGLGHASDVDDASDRADVTDLDGADGIADVTDVPGAGDVPDTPGSLGSTNAPAADGDPVEFLGHVDYDEMPAVYRAADLLVLPSRAEGMPRSVLEARASATPVVTTDLEHLTFDDPGIRTVPVGDVDALAEAVVATLSETAVDGPPDSTVDGRGGSVAEGRADAATDELATAAVDGRTDGGAERSGGTVERTADGGTERTADGGVERTSDATDRVVQDWRSTVRRTTDALERLTEETSPHR